METGINIRILTAEDTAVFRQMLDLFGEAFGDRDTYTSKQPDDAYLASLLQSETFVGVAAMSGDRVVGGIASYILRKFEQARSELYLYDLAVDEGFRRRGIATAMIRSLGAFAATRGVYVMFVQADLGDDAAIALYQSLGHREDVLHFDIRPIADAK